MSALQELRDAIDHVTACTGDPDAWRTGLTPAELGTISAAVIDPAAVTGLLAKIRAHNPTLFDPRTGAPVTPPGPGTGQRGDAATAMKKAEADLAQQNSTAAQLDLHVITAILNAHAKTVEGAGQLHRLQQQIEDAVRSRTDLDTPAGARDFQRFLIGKLREIGGVVESAGLDDASKAALASAWTALYNSTAGTDAGAPAETAPPSAAPAAQPAPAAPAEDLPPYGSDLGDDPLLDALLAQETAPSGVADSPGPPASPPPAAAGGPPLTMPAALPGLGGAPLPAPLPADLTRPEPLRPAASETDELPLDEWLEPDVPPEEPAEDPATDSPPDEPPGEPAPDPAAATAVRLLDGSTVQAPTATLATVLRSAIAGTPIVDAFRAEGITIPPPGTAVAHPVQAGHVLGGDVGMFMDRQALAVTADRALLDGRIQPVAAVGGPSFLGWLHPQGRDTPTPAAPPSPTPGGAPPPTRPAAAAAR